MWHRKLECRSTNHRREIQDNKDKRSNGQVQRQYYLNQSFLLQISVNSINVCINSTNLYVNVPVCLICATISYTMNNINSTLNILSISFLCVRRICTWCRIWMTNRIHSIIVPITLLTLNKHLWMYILIHYNNENWTASQKHCFQGW